MRVSYLGKVLQYICIPWVCSSLAMAEPLTSIWVGVNSSGIVDGVSYTDNNTQLSLSADIQIHQNVMLGGQLHTAKADTVRQRHRGFSSYVAYDKLWGDDWLVGASLTHRRFFKGSRNWNYTHTNAYIRHRRGVSVGLMYSPRYYATRFSARQYSLGYQKDLGEHFYTRTRIHHFELASTLNYQHAQLNLGANIDKFNIELGYHWVSDTFRPTPIGFITSPQWQLRAMYTLF